MVVKKEIDAGDSDDELSFLGGYAPEYPPHPGGMADPSQQHQQALYGSQGDDSAIAGPSGASQVTTQHGPNVRLCRPLLYLCTPLHCSQVCIAFTACKAAH